MIYISYIALVLLALIFMAFCGWILKGLFIEGGFLGSDEEQDFLKFNERNSLALLGSEADKTNNK